MEIKSCTMKAPACIYIVHVVWFGLAKTVFLYISYMSQGPFSNEKYSKIIQNSQTFHSYPHILIPKCQIC